MIPQSRPKINRDKALHDSFHMFALQVKIDFCMLV